MSSRSFAIAVLSGLLLLGTPAAHAQQKDPASAQVLFDQGRKLMQQQRWTEAAAKFEESQRQDPAGGTLLHLALCREREGRVATAWAVYQDALTQARRDQRPDRAKLAQERIDALGPKLPRMRVRVPAADRKLPGFTVMRDELTVGEAQWGEAMPVDPGARTIKAQADGYKTWTTRVDVATTGEVVVEVPELEVEPKKPEPEAKKPEPVHVAEPPPEKPSSTQRTVGIVVGGLGVAGLATGSVLGYLSLKKHDDADAQCRPPDYKLCSAAGVAAGDQAVQLGTGSTIAFIAGGVLLAGGAILYFTAPSSGVSLAPSFGPGGGGLVAAGTFR